MFFDSHGRLAFTKIRYLRPKIGVKYNIPTIDSNTTPAAYAEKQFGSYETGSAPPPAELDAGSMAERPVPPRRSPAASGLSASNWLLKLAAAAAIITTMILLMYGCRPRLSGTAENPKSQIRNQKYYITYCRVAQLAAHKAHPVRATPAPASNAQNHGAGDAAGSACPELTLEIAWLIVWSAESDCGQNLARGDGGAARGHAQYHKRRWAELCKKTARNYRWPQDCYDAWKVRDLTIAGWLAERPDEVAAGDVETLVRRHRLPNRPYRADNQRYWNRACKKARTNADTKTFNAHLLSAEARCDSRPGQAGRGNTATDGQTTGECSINSKEAWAAVATYLQKETEADFGRGDEGRWIVSAAKSPARSDPYGLQKGADSR